MMKTATRGASALLFAFALLLASPAIAQAHTGEGVSTRHIVIEMGTWALGIVATLALVVAFFYVRARLMRKDRP